MYQCTAWIPCVSKHDSTEIRGLLNSQGLNYADIVTATANRLSWYINNQGGGEYAAVLLLI
jgi:hypothetical protein